MSRVMVVFRRCALVAVAALVVVAGGVGTAEARSTALSPTDRAFLAGAHQSNLAEIATGKLAQAKGQSAEVKELGAMLVADHTALDAALREVAASVRVSLPATPNAEQRAMQAQLSKASGEEFDAMFVAGQLKGHAAAMALGEKELSNGTDASVKKAAADSAPVIMKHHEMFMAQAKAMGLPASVHSGLSGVAASAGHQVPAVLMGLGCLLIAGGLVLAMRRRTVG
ncbi:DUF4142 domain-containing protein [Kribbella sp. CA-247076]|uniref:DUF4142 domain-containing protein n=1 Tax=Kribbella sp. CA-247076 TaxID=3239941 RepID=UPI003D8CE6DB